MVRIRKMRESLRNLGSINSLSNHDATRAILALVIFFAAGVACVSAGDEAQTNASLGTTNATIYGTANLAGARVATDRGDYSTTTSATGSYTLNVAGDKTYNVFATANGYKTVVVKGVRVTVGENESVSLRFTELLAAGEKTYMGSSQCKLCHSTQHTRWVNTAHRFGISAPGDSPGILAGPLAQFRAGYDLVAASDFSTYGANAPRLSFSGDTYLITIGSVAYPVTYTMGYQWKQRYITLIGEAHYVLPIQYNVATGGWVAYNATDWYSGTTPIYSSSATLETNIYKKNSWERKCLGCHSVTGILKLEYSASPTSGITQHRSDWLEKGIGCEMCHGPGSAHVWANGAVGDALNPNIINPSRLTANRQNDVCGQCHSRGLSVSKLAGVAADSHNVTSDTWTLEYYYDGSRTFRPGDTLVQYYTDNGGYWGSSDSAEVKSSKQHHQQWNDYYQSAHTAPGAALTVTCVSCHDAHGPIGYARQLKLSGDDNSLCLSCHGPLGAAKQRFATAAAMTQHTGDSHTTYAPGTTGAGRCITCHMPYMAKSAVNYDIRSHTFRVSRPHNTRRFYRVNATQETMPNSCQQACHNPNSTLGTSFGATTDSASTLLAAQRYDQTVEHPAMVTPDTGTAKLTGTISVGGADTFDDTFGVWVSANFTNRAAVTNRNGVYYLALDAPGTYTISAMKPGYDSFVTETVNVLPGQVTTLNMAMVANANARFVTRPYRCNACHGGNWGAEWRKSGFAGAQLAEAEGSTDLSAGHGLMAFSPSASCGPKCHEGRSAEKYIRTGDTVSAGYPNIGAASRRSQTCQVCHKPHDSNADTFSQLWQYRTTQFDTGYFYAAGTGGAYGSMILPAPYKSTACLMCHNGRTAPKDSGSGISAKTAASVSTTSYTNGSTRAESGTASNPHVGNNAEGFFGIYRGTTMAAINFDSAAGFVPRNSTHSETNWGQLYSYQAYVYSSGAPKLVSQSGVPVVKTDSFTCVSCHMYSQDLGTHSGGTNAARDGGHTWKPDIRACGVCHDPVYISINPYTNNLKSGSGDVGTWGTGSWGVSSAGVTLGFDRPVSALPHTSNTGGTSAGLAGAGAPDAVSNDYDGDGVAEGAHTEAKHLFERVVACMEYGTHDGQTSGTAGNVGLGDTLLISVTTGKPANPYWIFNRNRSIASNAASGGAGSTTIEAPNFPLTMLTEDELRCAYNLILFDHDETNLGVHNLRYAVETLRTMWAVLGKTITGNRLWVPPGDDY